MTLVRMGYHCSSPCRGRWRVRGWWWEVTLLTVRQTWGGQLTLTATTIRADLYTSQRDLDEGDLKHEEKKDGEESGG